MIEEIKRIGSTKKDLRKFGLTIGIILLLIGGLLFWKEKLSYQYFLVPGALLIVSGISIPVILKPLYLAWMTFATIVGWIMTRVVLSILYYVITTPTGLLLRRFNKQFLELKWDKSQDSYWNWREKTPIETDNHEKQF